jgi:hypothetical protein
VRSQGASAPLPLRVTVTFASVVGVAGVVVATCGGCGSNDIEGGGLENGDKDATSSLFAISLGGDGCGVQIPNLGDDFLAAMPDCGGGLGKCVPPSPMMPPAVTKQLSACEGSPAACVPLSFLKANKEPLKKCVSYGKADGVCVSRVIPTIDKLSFLPQDACKPEERCAPCANPIDGKVTGICDIGKPPSKPPEQCKKEPVQLQCPYEGKPVLNVEKLKSCAPKGMHCLPKSVVPEAFASLLTECKDAPDALCAPDKSIEANGQYIPKTCASIGGSEGRCLHQAIPQVAAQAKFLPSEGCDSYERCIPCFDPLSGAKLPSCSVSCDPGPTKPPYVFAKCAGDKGRCVPKTAVPPEQAKNLRDTDCKKGEEVCAPVIAIDRNAKPQMCELKMLGIPRAGKPAVCVEDVLTIGLVLSQSNCPEGFKCTPCNNPLENDAPTGLPGCPAGKPP